MIIQGDMAGLPPDSTKYQIIVRGESIEKGLPMYLRTRYAFHAPDSAADPGLLGELVKELLDLPMDPALETSEFALQA